MGWNDLGQIIPQFIAAAGGGAGVVALISAWWARRTAAGAAEIDMRRVVDAATSALIRDLQLHRETCEKRLDALEKAFRALKRREAILTQAVIMAGVPLPVMPEVELPEGD